MTPVLQTRLYKEGETRGNCLAACVASLFGLPLEKVPDFGNSGKHYGMEFIDFIEYLGFDYNGCPLYDPSTKYEGVDGYLIVNGRSPRNYDIRHSTIYKDGILVHDSHPDNTGLLETEDCFLIERRA